MKKDNSQFAELENRLVKFAVSNFKIAEGINNSFAGQHIKNQLIRAGSSPALNYAEARFAESGKDFIRKLKIVLKDLCETRVCLNLLIDTNYYRGKYNLKTTHNESNELIAIFIASINTAQKSQKQKKAMNLKSARQMIEN